MPRKRQGPANKKPINRMCKHLNCFNLTTDEFCPEHAHEAEAADIPSWRYDKDSPRKRGYSGKWDESSRWFRRYVEPYCRICREQGRGLVFSQVTDHIIPHQGDHKLFWDRDNWQGLCERCHNLKSQRERDDERIRRAILKRRGG